MKFWRRLKARREKKLQAQAELSVMEAYVKNFKAYLDSLPPAEREKVIDAELKKIEKIIDKVLAEKASV